MFQAILNNHLELAVIIALLLLLVPALVMSRHKLRDASRQDRRKHARPGVDRRA